MRIWSVSSEFPPLTSPLTSPLFWLFPDPVFLLATSGPYRIEKTQPDGNLKDFKGLLTWEGREEMEPTRNCEGRTTAGSLPTCRGKEQREEMWWRRPGRGKGREQKGPESQKEVGLAKPQELPEDKAKRKWPHLSPPLICWRGDLIYKGITPTVNWKWFLCKKQDFTLTVF